VRRGVTLTLILLLFTLAVEAARRTGGTYAARPAGVIPGIVVVKVRTGRVLDGSGLLKGATPAGNAMRAEGVSTVRRAFPFARPPLLNKGAGEAYDLTRIYLVAFPSERDPETVAQRLSRMPEIEYAEPKYYQQVLDTPNDPLLPNQIQALTRMNVFAGWSIAKGSPSVAIATVDGGIYWRHEDLQPGLWVNNAEDINHNGAFDSGPPPAGDEDGIDQDGNGFADDVVGWNFTTGTNDPTGLPTQPGNASHGTAVSSHFGAATNNGKGMAGTSWNCSLMPLCAAATGGDNLIQFGYEAIEYAARMGARVINCSWGRVGGYSNFEQEVMNAAAAAGALVVAAAGNNSGNNDYLPHYPSSYRNVLGVGATNSSDDARAVFSNYGVSVPVFAPGVSIWSALTNGGYGNGGSGTSYASPLVAGLAGLLRAARPSWTPQQVAAQIRVTADSIDAVFGNEVESGKLGRGRVNFARALAENHAALEVISTTLVTSTGRTLFVRGDTVLVNVRVRNLLFAAANAVQFRLSSFDPELGVLSGTAMITAIAPGEEVDIPAFVCRVSEFATARTVVLKLEWASNGNEADAYALRTNVYPSAPLWLVQSSPTTLSLFSVRAVNRAVAWASGGNGSGTEPVVLRTTDGGGVWGSVTSNLPPVDLYCIEAFDADRAWVGTGGGQIYATTNGGQSWSAQPYPGSQSGFIDGLRFFDAQVGYALGDPPSGSSQFVLLRTTDGGSTWNHFASEPVGTTGEAGWNNSFAWTDSRHGWFGTNVSRIWRTSDGGTTWQNAASGASSSFALAFRDSLTGVVGHNDGVVGRSTDGGLSWATISFPSSATVTGIALAPGEPLVWASTAIELFRSPNGGGTWVAQVASPFSGGINHLSFADTSRGWGVTSNGEVLRYSVFEQGTGVVSPALPAEYGLAQNFPNPFNPTTVVSYQLPVVSDVKLVVYDLLGREVAVLVHGRQDPGSHTIRFNANGMASGMYVYRLTADNFVETRKMMLMK